MQDSKKSVLIGELTDFNAGLLQEMDKHTTRGIRNVLSWCAIGGADLIAGKEGAQIGGAIGCIGGAVGAVAGFTICGAVCAAGASYLAYLACYGFSIVDDDWVSPPPSSDYIYNNPLYFLDALCKVTTEDMKTYEEESAVNLRFPEGYEHVEEVGIIHNIALRNIFEDYSDTTYPEMQIACDTIYIANERLPKTVVYNALDIPEFKSAYQQEMDCIRSSLTELGAVDLERYMERKDATGYSEITVSILELFMDIYTQYPSKLEDIDFIINYYVEKIANSPEVPEEEVESLYTALAIAAYSPRLWKPIFEKHLDDSQFYGE